MNAPRAHLWHSPVALTAFVGFIMLFSAVMAGYGFVDAGREKWGDPVWTGGSAGAAIEGFLTGANAKSVKSARNPHPEVLPPTLVINQRVFSQHARLLSWLDVAGELLLPIGILALILVRFRRSRMLLIGLTMLAASLNFLYLTEGDSSANPPMIFMWLAILWLVTLWPAAALFFAVDLGAPADHPRAPAVAPVEPGAGLWLFFLAILLVIVAGSLEMYWDRFGTFVALAAAAVALTTALTLIKGRAVHAPRRETMRPVADLRT